MTKSVFAAPHFNDEAAAYAYVEARIWANGGLPQCGVIGKSGALTGKDDRIGLYKCYACRKTVHGEGRHHLRGQPRPDERDWLLRDPPDLQQQEGRERATSFHRTLGDHAEKRLVHGRIASAKLMRTGGSSPDGRRWRRGRD